MNKRKIFASLVLLAFAVTVFGRELLPNPEKEAQAKPFSMTINGITEYVEHPVTVETTRDQLFYHDGTFEGQLGCGGGCALGVRFTPPVYPAIVNSFDIWTQGDASCFDAVVSVYLDEEGLAQGPPSAPTAPYDGTAVFEVNADLSSPDGSLTQTTIDVGELNILSGDYYVIIWENDSGFLGIANDLQLNYIDHNWAFTEAWSTIYDAVGGDPSLAGNFGITTNYIPGDIDGAYFSVSPSSIDFGTLLMGEYAEAEITISNFGNAAGDVLSITSNDPDLVITGGTGTVEPGGTLTASLMYLPTVEGIIAGTISIMTTADNQQEFTVAFSAEVFEGFPEVMIWNPVGGGDVIADILAGLGTTSTITTNMFDFGDPVDVGYSSMFILLGMYPNNFVVAAGSAEATAIENYLASGGNVYLEGGDCWYYDPLSASGHDFGPSFAVTGLADGAADLATVSGADFLTGVDFAYAGENNYVDQLQANSSGFEIHENADVGYFCGIANASPGGFNTIGNAFQFEGLVDGAYTKADLLESYLNFFDNIFTDEIPPSITGVTNHADTADETGPYTIYATVSDNTELASVDFAYHVDGGEGVVDAMTAGVDDQYSYDIPGQAVGSYVTYYVTAVDTAGNEAISDAYDFYVVTDLPPGDCVAIGGTDGFITINWTEPGGGSVAEDINIHVGVDGWASEATWNVFDHQAGSFLFDVDMGFSANYEEYDVALTLSPGSYTIECYDTYGDGGIAGVVTNSTGSELLSWGASDYTDFGQFDFIIGGVVLDRDLTGYNIYRDDAILTNLDSDVLEYIDATITNGIEYCYHVTAIYDLENESTPTDQSCAMGVGFPPSAPTGLAFTVDNYTVFLDWADNLEYDIVGYNIFRDDALIANSAVSEFSETLELAGGYIYYVTALDDEGLESEASAPIMVPVGPAPPNFLMAAGDLDGQVDLEWGDPGWGNPPSECADFMITGLPFSDINSNVGMGDDFPVQGSQGADVAYELNLDVDIVLDITVCSANTDYDTKLEIFYDDCVTTTNYYNDDNTCEFSGLQSSLLGVVLPMGQYLIVVDGYGGAEGTFEINITESVLFANLPTTIEENFEAEFAKSGEGSLEEWIANMGQTSVYDANRELTGFAIHRDGAEIATTDAIARTYTDYDVVNGMEYCYVVYAMYAAGDLSGSAEACATPVNHEPPTPENLVATSTDDVVDLSWDAVDVYDFDFYNIYRKDNSDDFAVIGTATDVSFTDNLPGDGVYKYYVTTVDFGGLESGGSNQVTVLFGNIPPANLSATSGEEGIIPLQWSAPGETGEELELVYDDGILANAFYFYTTYEDGNAHGMRFDVGGSFDVLSASIKILSEEDEYWPWPNETHGPVRVMIFDDAGGMPGNLLHDEEAIAENGWATVYPGLVGLNNAFYVIASHYDDWSTSGDPEGYGIDGAVDYPNNMYTLSEGTWYTDDYLGYGGDYMHRATVLSMGGLKTISYADNTQMTADSDALRMTNSLFGNNPTGTNTFASAPQIDNSQFVSRDLFGFNIYRALTAGVEISPTNLIGFTDAATLEYDDTVENGVEFFYVVTADYGVDGESGPSNEVGATATNYPPATPTGLVATGGGGVVTLEWNDNTDSDFASYKVYRSFGGGAFEVIVSGIATSNYTDIGLVDGVYEYYVTAVDDGGLESEASESAEVLFGNIPPTNLVAESGHEGFVPLSWSAPGGGGGSDGDEIDEGFEANFPPDGWLTVDNDGDLGAEPTWGNWTAYEYSPHSGTFAAASASWSPETQVPLTPDNWMISPAIAIGSNSELHFWAACQDPDWASDHYSVKLSTSGTDLGDFTTTLFDETLENDVWHEVVLDLSGFDGETVHLAWQHHECTDWFVMKIDDISVINAESREVLFSADFEDVCDFEKFSYRSGIASKNAGRSRELQGYNIYHSSSPSVEVSPDNLAGSVAADVTTFDDWGVEAGVEYYFVVTADYGVDGESGTTNEASAIAALPPSMLLWGASMGMPGGSGTFLMELENLQNFGGLQFNEQDFPDYLTFTGVEAIGRAEGFTTAINEIDGVVTFVMYSMTGDAIEPGEGAILEFSVEIDEAAQVGQTIECVLSGIVASDEFGNQVSCSYYPGGFLVNGLLGDLTQDGNINVLDVVRLIAIVLEQWTPSDYEMWAGDLNGDGSHNVLDVVQLVQIILSEELKVSAATSVDLYVSETTITLKSDGALGGIQFDLDNPNALIATVNGTDELAVGNNRALLIAWDGVVSTKTIQLGEPVEITNVIAANSNGESVDVTIHNIPSEFALEQNYPNPFNPSTVISYQLPVNGDVQLAIYNIAGQLIETLVSDAQDAGYYSIEWNGSGCASGVYFYQLNAGTFSETNKMVLMK